ncbi:MAG: NfeD family protein [Pseudomonadota bacterium]
MDLFAVLDGASPWWWVAAALAIGALELITFSYFMLWIALAAASVGAILWIVPDYSGTAQIATFSVLLLIYTVAGWQFIGRREQGPEASTLNNRASAMVGRQAIAAEIFRGNTGAVEIDGVRWRGRLGEPGEDVQPGAEFTVIGTEGMTLLLEKT